VLSRFEAFGLKDIDAIGGSEALDRALRSTHAAAGATVGLGQDQRDFVPSGHQPRQCSLGKLGRARED
jgi:hypothetical protein